MNHDEALTKLITEVQEEYEFDHVLPLYMFAWSLAGLGIERSDEDFTGICREAYDAFRAANPELVLAWSPWPIRAEAAEVASSGTPIDLDLDPNGPVDRSSLLILLPPGDVPPALSSHAGRL